MAAVALEKVRKVYVDGTRAVDGLDLDVADGEFLVLVGPSGCGKTTALRMVAGLEEISEGTVRIGDRIVNQVPARDRDVAMVFQSYALYPHLDVRANIGFGLKLRKLPTDEIERRVTGAAETLGLREDEPLSNLDAKLRVQMRAEIARTTRQMGVTTIYVTHDQTEAMTLGHRVAVLKKGVLQQVAVPQELYDRPANLFVAGFIGSPAMNLLQGVFAWDGQGLRLFLGEQQLTVPAQLLQDRPALREYLNRPVAVGVRPEDLADAALVPAADGTVLHAVPDLTEALGSDLLVHFGLAVPGVVTEDTRELARDAGTDLAETKTAPAGTVVVARFNPRSRVREGEPVRVAVDVGRLHVFDLRTGRAIW
ncbi:MAG: ABC transporter ATP-binding protein [Actinobacteria bacterium 13_2_20CM_2_71_6]|nr:MAG: ABC transporter ATP-binding protein [Actinobacteria bacterium 13_2_20CM_2_71_6]